MKTIAIDNGHGANTPGKRTPMFPGTNKFIHEWEFNHPTAKKLGKILMDRGFKVIYTSDTKNDTSLRARTNIANDSNADIFVSIHYNALTGKWGNQQGIETYHHPNSKQGKKLAKLVHDNLIKDTQRANRKVKSANFFVLRETKMPAILPECGFMDNLEEANLMLDENYQIKCARAIAKGICEYFGVKFEEDKKEEIVKNDKLYKVQVGAFSVKDNATNLLKDLDKKGYKGFITEEEKENKSKYYKIGDAHIIETIPENIYIDVLGDTLRNKGVYGINGTFFDTKTAPVTNPNSCVFIAMNGGKAISHNAQFNGWKSPARATVIYHKDGKLGFRQLKDINPIKDNTVWAIGGYMVKPYMDFKNEKIPSSINYKTSHTYLGYDNEGKIYLIVKPDHMIRDIVPLLNELKINNCIALDGGGSSELNYLGGEFVTSRKINTAVLLKEI